jgi:HJR/Mrr/RecB family endonuclease
MSLLTRSERRMIIRLFKFSIKSTIAIVSLITSIVILDIHLITRAYKWIKHYLQYRKLNLTHLQIQKLITKMSGRQFEIFIYGLLKANGYKVKLTPPSADGGKDLIIHDKQGDIYVEIKRYLGTFKVDRPMIQKLIGSATGDGVKRTWFINTGIYTNEALDFANKVDMKIWDMKDILELIYSTSKEKIPSIIARTFSYKDDNEILDSVEQFTNGLEQFE